MYKLHCIWTTSKQDVNSLNFNASKAVNKAYSSERYSTKKINGHRIMSFSQNVKAAPKKVKGIVPCLYTQGSCMRHYGNHGILYYDDPAAF